MAKMCNMSMRGKAKKKLSEKERVELEEAAFVGAKHDLAA